MLQGDESSQAAAVAADIICLQAVIPTAVVAEVTKWYVRTVYLIHSNIERFRDCKAEALYCCVDIFACDVHIV